jgi:hypothetical protein
MKTTVPVRLPIRPWLRDHCFNGRVILPAVEAMRLLAQTVQHLHPAGNILAMDNAKFQKFLEIPPNQDRIDILVEVGKATIQGIHARLLTRKQLKTMTRLTSHCELLFGQASDITPLPSRPSTSARTPIVLVSAERIYRELVPFGPMYRSLYGQVSLWDDSARGSLRAPDLPLEFTPVGSPFPLDGAMHAACVHGQRLIDFVPFPVGFISRTISKPTEPGKEYGVDVHLRGLSPDELVYDLQIFDSRNRIRETLTGLTMRDVSNGRIKPPDWIKATSSPKEMGQETGSAT